MTHSLRSRMTPLTWVAIRYWLRKPVSRIRARFAVDLKLQHFVEMPSIAELAQGLEVLSWSTAGTPGEGTAETASQEN